MIFWNPLQIFLFVQNSHFTFNIILLFLFNRKLANKKIVLLISVNLSFSYRQKKMWIINFMSEQLKFNFLSYLNCSLMYKYVFVYMWDGIDKIWYSIHIIWNEINFFLIKRQQLFVCCWLHSGRKNSILLPRNHKLKVVHTPYLQCLF